MAIDFSDSNRFVGRVSSALASGGDGPSGDVRFIGLRLILGLLFGGHGLPPRGQVLGEGGERRPVQRDVLHVGLNEGLIGAHRSLDLRFRRRRRARSGPVAVRRRRRPLPGAAAGRGTGPGGGPPSSGSTAALRRSGGGAAARLSSVAAGFRPRTASGTSGLRCSGASGFGHC